MWIVVALLGCSLALIALVGQVVSAQPADAGAETALQICRAPGCPGGANSAARQHRVDDGDLWRAFTATTNLQGSTPLWRVAVNRRRHGRVLLGQSGMPVRSAIARGAPLACIRLRRC